MADTDDIDTDDIDEIFGLMVEKANYLHHQLGSPEKRLMAISALPQLERDFYLVSNIVALTLEGNTGDWICDHHDEPGWIDCGVDAFTRIGYPQVGDGIKSYLAAYLEKGEAMSDEDHEIPSDYIANHALEIMQALHSYLVAHNFSFEPGDDAPVDN
jgi:hypothetical protein